MKLSLPIKLAILVAVIFGLLITGMFLWKPARLRYYESRLDSENVSIRLVAVEKLIAMGGDGFAIAEKRIGSKVHPTSLEEFLGEPVQKQSVQPGLLPPTGTDEGIEMWREQTPGFLWRYEKFTVWLNMKLEVQGILHKDMLDKYFEFSEYEIHPLHK
ncbi:MAG: hypothetical protein ACYS8W_09125 [Planctomycetota bacterium]|jgi:hypothetical protein